MFRELIALNIAKDANILADSVFINLHLFRAKVCDGMVVFIADHEIEQHFAGIGVNHRAVGLDGSRRTRLGKRYRQRNQSEQKRYEKDTCRHKHPN